ncbi:X-linked retinitis pigmentosa GTPase regulator-like [Procambarus clarkii]|uniref:X-linked retinitis pigmentosa GTPase regulator-like n=1 Tax=Procambarus clarkii TaxID=6728 RepID=UPI0037423AA2
MAVDDDYDIPDTGAVFTFGKSRFADNAPSKFWIKNDKIVELACGDEHTAVVTESGRVFMIGSNDMGQLGLGSTKPVYKPSCVKTLKPEKALHIACGRSHTIVSCASGAVYLWGHNGDGQLGTGNKEDHFFPVKVLKLDTPAKAVAAGSIHSLVLAEIGELYIWGSNSEGQLGLEVKEQLTPALLTLPQPVLSIACGYYHCVALTAFGRVYTWGESDHGKLGLPSSQLSSHHLPQVVPLPEKIIQVAAGSAHTLFLSEGGTVYSCGLGSNGELGQGEGELECFLPQQVIETNPSAIVIIAAGDNHSSAITEDGYLLTWGCGRHGKLCHGEENFSSQFLPLRVRRLRHIRVILVGCGGCHTMVLGYRRTEEVESTRDNSHLLHHSVNSLARARRRVADGILPPLKSVGLPPIKHSVLPTVPDIEDDEPASDQPQVDAEPVSIVGEVPEKAVEVEQNEATPEENGVLDVESEEEEEEQQQQQQEEEENTEDCKEQLPPSEKKGGRFARFFGNLGKKKSTSALRSHQVATEESGEGMKGTTASATKSKHPLEEDAHLESFGDPNTEESEGAVRQVMEAFTSSSVRATSSYSIGVPGHKQSKACTIL